jgi:hypothetical protein
MPHSLYPRAPSRNDPALEHSWLPVRAYPWRPFFLGDVSKHQAFGALYITGALLLVYFAFVRK